MDNASKIGIKGLIWNAFA